MLLKYNNSWVWHCIFVYLIKFNVSIIWNVIPHNYTLSQIFKLFYISISNRIRETVSSSTCCWCWYFGIRTSFYFQRYLIFKRKQIDKMLLLHNKIYTTFNVTQDWIYCFFFNIQYALINNSLVKELLLVEQCFSTFLLMVDRYKAFHMFL